jgi:phage terminase large subunit-like protein
MDPADREAVIAQLPDAVIEALLYDWRGTWARPAQLAPGSEGAGPAIRGRPGLADLLRKGTPPELEYSADWTTWLLLAGRGAGKTRTGAELVIEWAKLGPQPPIALVAPTEADAWGVMVSADPQPDQSGIVAVSPPDFRPRYVQGKRPRLIWPNGVTAYTYSAEKPERLRGWQHGKAWADEPVAWQASRLSYTWDMLMFGLRLGVNPQIVVTTTPKPIPWLVGARKGPPVGLLNDPRCMITRGRTSDNRANLAAAFIQNVIAPYEGTRMGRQEIDAEILSDIEGALWTIALIEAHRLRTLDGVEITRTVVAIDPQASEGTGETDQPQGPETGIVGASLGWCRCKCRTIEDAPELHVFVRADASGNFSPYTWGSKALALAKELQADRIIGEQNNGGAMVEGTIRSIDSRASYKAVYASRGKRTRAEPVAALAEQGKLHHVGFHPLLEDQLTTWDGGGASPNRLDALVWAVTELALAEGPSGADLLRQIYRR